MNALFGYLLVHFVEDPLNHREKIFLSLSEGDTPVAWRRLNHGEPVLESQGGTGGVRDPNIVRGPDGVFHILATDLRVWRPAGPNWWEFRHRGSRDLVIWDSIDLLSWSEPRFITLAPEGAGMAWAPKAVYDPISGDYLVFFSSGLLESRPAHQDSVTQAETGASRIMVTRTRDFTHFTPAESYLKLTGGVIDMSVLVTDTSVHRFAKHDDGAPESLHVFHQRGSALFADDFVTVSHGIGQEIAPTVEGPLAFRDNHESRWYLWVDQYSRQPQGYEAYTTTNIEAGDWRLVPDFRLPENTKHGTVLPLQAAEYEALNTFYPR